MKKMTENIHAKMSTAYISDGCNYYLPISLSRWLSWQRICMQCRRPGFDPWVGKIPWKTERLPTPEFWPGEFHGLYSPWGRKETQLSDFHFTHHKKTTLSNILNFFFNKSFKNYYSRKLNIHFIRC